MTLRNVIRVPHKIKPGHYWYFYDWEDWLNHEANWQKDLVLWQLRQLRADVWAALYFIGRRIR